MQPRLDDAASLLPDAFKALLAMGRAVRRSGVPESTLNLVFIRASQINACSVCLDMHCRDARNAGETDERLFCVAAWRDAPFFNDAERAALALTEAATRLSDRSDPVPDEIWNEAARHHDERGLAALVFAIGAINTWNRLNVITRQVAGSYLSAKATARARQSATPQA